MRPVGLTTSGPDPDLVLDDMPLITAEAVYLPIATDSATHMPSLCQSVVSASHLVDTGMASAVLGFDTLAYNHADTRAFDDIASVSDVATIADGDKFSEELIPDHFSDSQIAALMGRVFAEQRRCRRAAGPPAQPAGALPPD